MIEKTYCEECLDNLDYDKFHSLFERPVCQECVIALDLEPELALGDY
jgi:hypothetical protein